MPRIAIRSLTLRLLLSAGLWMAAALVAGGLVLSAAFRNYVEADFDERLTTRLDAMIGASEIEPEGYVALVRPLGDQRFSEPYSGWYWQVTTEGEEPFRSRSLWDKELDADLDQPAFSQRIYETEGPAGELLRIAERDVVLPESEKVFRYMVAGDTAEIRNDIARFNRLLSASLGALGVGLLAAIVLQVVFGLQPLRRLRREIAEIRSGRRRRLQGEFPTEISPLVSETNALLEHNEKVVERARTHVGNLAHALKTPLSVLRNEAETSDSQLATVVGRQVELMGRHIDIHLKRARAASGAGLFAAQTPVRPAIDDLVRAMGRIYAERGLDFDIAVEGDPQFLGERQDLDEMLGNLLDNACKWARAKVRISAKFEERSGERARLIIWIEDDGAGVDEVEIDGLFERGRRLDESQPGSGLGLPIVQEIAEMNGGSVNLERSSLGGIRACLYLPAAPN